MERMLINAGITSIDDVSTLFSSSSSTSSSFSAAASVTSLIIHGNHISSLTSSSSAFPLQLPSLRKLNLSSNDLRFIDTTDLQGCPNIEILDLAANRIVGIKGITSLTNLHTLNLAFNNLNDLQWLTSSLLVVPSSLSSSSSSSSPSISTVVPYSNLQRLDLRDNNITDTSELFHLRHLINIRELRFQDAEISSSSLSSRSSSGTIPSLSALSANPVCSKPTYLPIILAACPTLQILDGIPVDKWKEIFPLLTNTLPLPSSNQPSSIRSPPSESSFSNSTIEPLTATAPPPSISSTVESTLLPHSPTTGNNFLLPLSNEIISSVPTNPEAPSSVATGDVPTPRIDVAASRFLRRYLGPEQVSNLSSRKSSLSQIYPPVITDPSVNIHNNHQDENTDQYSSSSSTSSSSVVPVHPPHSSPSSSSQPPTVVEKNNPDLYHTLQHELRIENLENKLALLTASRSSVMDHRGLSTIPPELPNVPVPATVPPSTVKSSSSLPTATIVTPSLSSATVFENVDETDMMDLTNVTAETSFTIEETNHSLPTVTPTVLPTVLRSPIPEAPLTRALRKAKNETTGNDSASLSLASPLHSTTVPSPEDFGAIRQRLTQLQADHSTTVNDIQQLRIAYAEVQKTLTDTQADLQMALERGRIASTEVERLRTELAIRPPIDAVERLRTKLAESQSALAAAPSREVVEALQARVNDYAAEAARLQATADEAHRIATRGETNANDAKQIIHQVTTERDKLSQDNAILQSENHNLRINIHREKELRDRTEEAGRLASEQLTISATQALVRAKEAETLAQTAKQAEQEAQRSEARAVAEATAARADAEHWKARYQEAIERGRQDIEAERQRAMSAIQAAEERLIAARTAAEEEVRRVTVDANSRLTGAREALEAHANKHATLSKALNDTKTEVADLSRRLAAAQVDIVEKDRRITALRDDLTVMERERNIALSSAHSSMSNKISDLINRIDTAEANARASKAETESLQTTLQSTRNEVRVKEVQLTDANETIKKLRKEINILRDEATASENGYKQAIEEVRQQFDELTGRYDQMNHEHIELLNRVEVAETSAVASRKVVTQLEGVVRELQGDANAAEALRRSLTEKESALSFIEREVAQVKTSFDQRVTALTNDKENFRKEATETKLSLALATDTIESQRQDIVRLQDEIKHLRELAKINEQQYKEAQIKVSTVEAEMRVLLNELDTTRVRSMEQSRRMTAWLSQMQVEVMGNNTSGTNTFHSSGSTLPVTYGVRDGIITAPASMVQQHK